MSADVTAWLDALESAHKAATPGPWTPATAPAEDSDETHAEYLTGALRPNEGRPLWVAWASVVKGLHDDSDYVVPVVTGDGPASEANARFVAAAHDALPALIAVVREVLDVANDWDVAAELYDAAAADYRAQGDLMGEGGHLIQAGDARRHADRIRSAVAAVGPTS